MAHLIDKDALVAEIEKKRNETADSSPYLCGMKYAYKNVLEFINSIEVKEVDFEKEYKDFINSDNGRSMFETAKHFFELGLKVAQKGEEV